MKDLSFLEFKDTDTPDLKGMKAYWQMVMDMPEPERKVFLQEERVREEERHLQWMVDCNKKDDEFIQFAIQKARVAAKYVDGCKHEEDRELYATEAEQWAGFARSYKVNKYTISDIRKQRERVQWEKRKLRTMQPNAEPSQSSEVSKT